MRARANNECLNQSELVVNIRKLLQDFTEIPTFLLSTIYQAKFGEVLDCCSVGYESGLLGLLRSLGGMVELRHGHGGACYLSLARDGTFEPQLELGCMINGLSNQILVNSNALINIKRKQSIDGLFSRSSFLWSDTEFAKLLDSSDIIIEKSAFEIALECHEREVCSEVARIRKFLNQFPDGIRLSDISCYLRVNRRLFNVATCLNALTLELPEIFYRQESLGEPHTEPLIYDGFSHTVDLDNKSHEIEPACSKIVTNFINQGLYQKTLLLIRESGVRGLKLNVWARSILSNFHRFDSAEARQKTENQLTEIDVIKCFKVLASNELLELMSSDHCRNDLRAFLPRKPVEYLKLKSKHKDLVGFDDLSSIGDKRHDVGRNRARTIEILLKSRQNRSPAPS